MRTLPSLDKTQPSVTEAPEPRSVTLVLGLPPSDCAPNLRSGRGHWSHRARAARSYRYEAAIAARDCGRLTPPVRVTAMFRTAPHPTLGRSDGTYRPLDAGNAIAALKAAIDGIVDAGVIPNDRAETLHWGEVRISRESGPCVVVKLTEVIR